MDTQSSTFIVTDSVNAKGMVYAANYANAYTDRSIVDRAYVDGAVDASILILGQATEGVTVTITAPQIAVVGSKYIIKDESGNAGGGGDEITVQGAGGALIDGEASIDISVDYGSLTLYSDGTDLWVW